MLSRLHVQYPLIEGYLCTLVDAYTEELLAGTPVADRRQRLESLQDPGPKRSRPLSAEVFSWRRLDGHGEEARYRVAVQKWRGLG